MADRKRIENLFDSYRDEAGEPLAAAILVLAQSIEEAVDRIDHKIALGLRYGLFGTDAKPTVSINDGLEALANSIDEADLKISEH